MASLCKPNRIANPLRRCRPDWRTLPWEFVLVFCLAVSSGYADESAWLTAEGQHVRVISDGSDAGLLEDLVVKFDAAVPQWLTFWGASPDSVAGWKIEAYVMKDVESFRAAGKLPPTIPRFQYGFASTNVVWVRHQASDYYTRHLLLHEGVHALALRLFGGGGPSWYMEGTAELLATHRDPDSTDDPAMAGLLAQRDRTFLINQIPRTREESPHWGRFKLVDQFRKQGRLPSLKSVLKLPMNLEGEVQSYTWCWAVAMLMTEYPETRQAFLKMAVMGRDSSPAFTAKLMQQIHKQWPVLQARWAILLHDLEYGFDWQQARVALSTSDPRYDGRPMSFFVEANRGWQSVGVWVPARARLRLAAAGTCQIRQAAEGEVWTSTPAGLTARFHRDAPLGQLQYCVLPIAPNDGPTLSDMQVEPVGDSVIGIDEPSWLLLRINDRFGSTGIDQRGDNQGGYRVELSAR